MNSGGGGFQAKGAAFERTIWKEIKTVRIHGSADVETQKWNVGTDSRESRNALG
jgi:hypothetical protein